MTTSANSYPGSKVGMGSPLVRTQYESGSSIIGLIAVLTLAFCTLIALRGWPYMAVLSCDVIMVLYLANSFRSKFRIFFFAHPLVLFVCSFLFIKPFLQLGDGPTYSKVLHMYFDTHTLTFGLNRTSLPGLSLDLFKFASFGILPVFTVPEYLFANPTDNVYYIWQGAMHLMLIAIATCLAKRWRTFEDQHLLFMSLFAAVSPSFFDLGSTPTRHIVTFFGVYLFFIAYVALRKTITIGRVATVMIAVVLIAVSKAPLLIPTALFAIVDQVTLTKFKLDWRFIVLAGVPVVFYLAFQDMLMHWVGGYLGISQGGAATFSSLVRVPILGVVIKYIYAFLSPFPWSKSFYYIDVIYGGNWLLFLMHMGSALIGLYMCTILIMRGRLLLRASVEVKRGICYAVVMSLSILMGAIGYHVYLLVYFPFLAPLLAHRSLLVSWKYPLLFVTAAELFADLASGL